MIVIGNITLEQVSSSQDETWDLFKNVLLMGISILVLLAGLGIQRRLGVFLKNNDARIINRIIQSHRVRTYKKHAYYWEISKKDTVCLFVCFCLRPTVGEMTVFAPD
jgi:hypothetical protein